MKEKKKFGFTSQCYEAPRAESVAVAQESILCASILDGITTSDYEEEFIEWGGDLGGNGGN